MMGSLCWAMLYIVSCIFVNGSETLNCNDVKIGNTKRTKDIDEFSFTITADINQTWFSTCGSEPEFDTYLKVLNSSGSLIAQNDDSPECGDKAFLHLDNLTIGSYTLQVTGYDDSAGQYSLQMFCNNFTGWPDKQCNHISFYAVHQCTSLVDLINGTSSSQKWTCDDDQSAIFTEYNSTSDCSGNEDTHRFNRTLSNTCNASENCNYSLITYREGYHTCVNHSNSRFRESVAVVTDVCLPGNFKFLCTSESVILETYPNVICSGQPSGSYDLYTLGCESDPDEDYEIFVESIKCYNKPDPELNITLLIIIASGIAIILLVIIVCIVKRCQHYRPFRRRRNESLRMSVNEDAMSDMSLLMNK